MNSNPSSQENFNSNQSSVSLVLTSCGRWDLLERTLQSYVDFKSDLVGEFILIDDSGLNSKKLNEIYNKFKIHFKNSLLIENPKNLGQVKSIDIAYAQVNSEYILHLEDDWEFFEEGFVEEGLVALSANPKILNCIFRDKTDLKKNREAPLVEQDKAGYFVEQEWVISFNPSLRRVSDYKKTNQTYTEVIIDLEKKGLSENQCEKDLSKHYKELGYYSVYSKGNYCRHIGYHRHATVSRFALLTSLKLKIKKLKSQFYKT